MRRITLARAVFFITAVSFVALGCQTREQSASDSNLTADSGPSQDSKDEIFFAEENTFDLTVANRSREGLSYLGFMRQVKAAMDRVNDGYPIGDSKAMQKAFDLSDKKVQQKVNRLWDGIDNVKKIADGLAGKTATPTSLPNMITGSSDRYGLATFIGLASGGGVKVKYAAKNIAYNIHYEDTEQRSGRSFGTGPERGANDASDKQYLGDLEEYGRSSEASIDNFYATLIRSLLNLDVSNYPNINNFGQAILTDFLAVYTAEQARNLMDGRITLHWDAALLEVTLLGAFHSGQSKFKFYYSNPVTKAVEFTDSVYNQKPGCDTIAKDARQRNARMSDYWQFSKSSDPKNCKRSGINITKNEFRRLGRRITAFMRKNYKTETEAVAKAVADERSENLYESLSKYILYKVGDKSPDTASIEAVVSAWLKFLSLTNDNADAITNDKSSQSTDTDGSFRPEAETFDQVSDGFASIYAEDEALAKILDAN